jgi:asparagine synthase (glutamine-hydrolysing)
MSVMCGIVAIQHYNAHASLSDIRRGMAQLKHRGPDADGTWLSPDRKVALGHVRLSIVDIEGGAQPIANETAQAA